MSMQKAAQRTRYSLPIVRAIAIDHRLAQEPCVRYTLEIAEAHSAGSNGIMAWARTVAFSARVKSGESVKPRWALMIPSAALTSVVDKCSATHQPQSAHGSVP